MRIAPTARGEQLADEALRTALATDSARLAPIDRTEQQTAAALLRRLLANAERT